MSSEYQQLVRAWSVRLMKKLYNERPRFCDVAIECIPTRREDGTDAPVQNTVYAHRAVLAARTLYFQQAFLGAAGYQEGATLQVSPHESLGPSDLGQLDTMPSAHYNGENDGEASAGMQPAPTNEIVKGARVTFKESAHVLERIVEFMYLGEIAKLEEGNSNTTEDDYNLWMWLLTWSFKHRVQDLFHYMLSHLMNMKLTPAFAARLLDLQIESSFSMSASVNMEDERTGYNMMLDNIRGHAIEWFNKADFNEDIFLPLNRQALLVVLTECVFQVPEYQVVKAVKRWSTASQWVMQAYSSAPMPRDQVHVIMQHTDPFCLTNLEFDELTHPPETSIYNRHTFAKYWDVMATHDGVRYNDSDRCLDRTVLVEKFRKPDTTQPHLARPSRTPSQPQPASPAPRPLGHTQSQDVIARPIPEVSMDPSVPLLTSIDEQARVDKGRPETAFVVGPNYFFKRDQSEFRYLVSLSVTTYQGLMYRGGIKNGKLKWSLDIVRQCDMFWMGVTANSGLDMSTMIARNQQVWMISEEGTCIEHCRNNAVTQAQPVRQRMNTLFIDCFKCVKNLPPSWKKVVMELDSGTGDLYVTLNDKEREHVFKNLPTHTRLFPCLMAVNTGQAHFELLDARMH